MRAADVEVGQEYATESKQDMSFWGIGSCDLRVRVLEVPVKPYRRYKTGGRWAYTRVLEDIDHGAPNNSALVEILDKHSGEPVRFGEDHEFAGQVKTTRVFLREIRMTWEDYLQRIEEAHKAREDRIKRDQVQKELRAINADRIDSLNVYLAGFNLEIDTAYTTRGNDLSIRVMNPSEDARFGSQERVGEAITAISELVRDAQNWRQ